MKKSKIEQELEALSKSYEQQIRTVAAKEFNRTIKPWLIKNSYNFIAGNGAWIIFSDGDVSQSIDEVYIQLEDMPSDILGVLQSYVEHSDNELGAWMPDFFVNEIEDQNGTK